MESNTSGGLRARKIIWVGDATGLPSQHEQRTDFGRFEHGRFIAETLICEEWPPSRFESVNPRFFHSFLDTKRRRCIEIHHSLVTALFLQNLCPCPFEYWSMDYFQSVIVSPEEFVAKIPDLTLLLLCWTADPDLKKSQHMYKQLRNMSDFTRHRVRCYPTFAELHSAERKVVDIKTLDCIAQRAWDPFFAFRPQTCFGKPYCDLLKQESFVVKRSHSSCSNHVCLFPDDESRNLLSCARGEYGLEGIGLEEPDFSAGPFWFHQQKIPSLIEYGEFRVFIISEQAKTNGAYVLETFLTKFIDNELRVRVLKPGHILDPVFCGTATLQELHQFALYVFDRLRSSLPEHRFESLEIGVRLDIGISSEEDGHRFFVNEITREWIGDYFSYYAKPTTKICSAIADARYRYFFETQAGVFPRAWDLQRIIPSSKRISGKYNGYLEELLDDSASDFRRFDLMREWGLEIHRT